MKQRHMMALLQKGYTTVEVQFKKSLPGPGLPAPAMPAAEGDGPGAWDHPLDRVSRSIPQYAGLAQPKRAGQPRGYVYKAKTSWGLKVGDFAIVYSFGELKTVEVIRVDAEPQIDTDADFDYTWIVQKIDVTEYIDLLEQEDKFLRAMNEVERKRQVERMRDEWLAALPEGSEARKQFDQAASIFGSVENKA